ncbi:MAG: hypothetical protein FWH29_06925 [Methanobrevibacter sp.]|nr:hypothetical protein [Methanobrevibacter sp.]
MEKKFWSSDRTPPQLEGEKKEKLLKAIREEIEKLWKMEHFPMLENL